MLAFSWQNKKIKIHGIINGSVTLKWYESYCNTLNTELILKFLKNMIKPPWIWLMYLKLYGLIFNLYWVWWNQIFVSLYKIYCIKIYSKATIYVCELILTGFSPFNIKCKKLNAKTSGNIFLGSLVEWVFHFFLRLHSIIGCALWYPITPWVFVDHVMILNSSPMHHLRWSYL